jgi:putative addiction module component (TIGR02574 family)
MTSESQRVLEEVLRLPDRERGELAAMLIDSLDPRRSEEGDADWDSKVAERVAELDDGRVELVPWTEARGRILGSRRGPSDS